MRGRSTASLMCWWTAAPSVICRNPHGNWQQRNSTTWFIRTCGGLFCAVKISFVPMKGRITAESSTSHLPDGIRTKRDGRLTAHPKAAWFLLPTASAYLCRIRRWQWTPSAPAGLKREIMTLWQKQTINSILRDGWENLRISCGHVCFWRQQKVILSTASIWW